MTTGNIKHNTNISLAKHFLNNIASRHSERYYYKDGMPRYSIIKHDATQTRHTVEDLIDEIERLKQQLVLLGLGGSTTAKKYPWYSRRKTLPTGVVVNYIPWLLRPIAILLSK